MSTEVSFSPYTLSPGNMFIVQCDQSTFLTTRHEQPLVPVELDGGPLSAAAFAPPKPQSTPR